MSKELKYALERHREGTALVVPILVRPCKWESMNFSKIQLLPTDGKFITKWANEDEAWLHVEDKLEVAIQERFSE